MGGLFSSVKRLMHCALEVLHGCDLGVLQQCF